MPGQIVTFPSNGSTAEGYLATPASGRGPGVIVIQEWWGLNDNIKGIADRFAAEGYLALAPDLYHGKVTKEPDEAGKMLMSMKMDEAGKDMAGAYDYLKGNSACTGKIGSVGYCAGGALALVVATMRPIDACVMYYGAFVGPEPDVSKLSGPVMMHYAEHDDWASPEKAHALEAKIRAAGKHAQLYIYPGTEHAFFNDTRPEVYNAEAADTSMARTLEFYKKQLA
jgi:carboxymethylenebutenolidase